MAKIKKIKSEENDIVLQSNLLVESPKNLSLQEYKLFIIVISKIDPKDDTIPIFRISASDFSKATGGNINDVYRDLRKAADQLLTRYATFHYPEKNLTVKINLTQQVRYLHGEGAIEIQLSEKIKPFLQNISREFTQYNKSNVCPLTSLYAIRLYELLKTRELFRRRVFDIAELRYKLGIQKNQYSRFADFRLRVLDTAKKEINSKTDLIIDYSYKKDRQKIIGIIFNITPNSTATSCLNEQSSLSTVKKIMNLGYSFPQALNVSRQTDPKIVDNAVDAVIEQVDKGNARRSRAMLHSAIKEEWIPQRKKSSKKPNTPKAKASPKKPKTYFSKLLDLIK